MADAEVRLGAQTAELQASMQAASVSVAQSLDGIKRALEQFTADNKKARDEAEKNNSAIASAFKQMQEQATGAFHGVTSAIEKFRTVFAGLAALLAGGYLWKESVEALLHEEEAVRGLQIVFGMTAEKATEMNVALHLAGMSAETFEQMAFKVGRMLRTQSDEFDRLRVKTKDANGEFLPMDQILQNLYTRMQDFKAGTDQNLFALSTVGRSAKDFASDMERLTRVQERARELMHDLNIEMGEDRQSQIESYRVEYAAFGVLVEEIGQKIGEVVLPTLMSLAKYFNETGPSAMSAIVKSVVLVIATIDTLSTGAKEDYLIVKTAWENITIAAVALWDGVKAAFTVGGPTVAQIWENMNKRILRNTLETNAEVLGLEADLVKRLNDLSTPGKIPEIPGGPTKPKSGSERFTTKPTGGDTRLEEFRDELRQMQEAEGYFHEFSKVQEAAFWDAKLALVRGGTKEDLKLRRDLHALSYAAKKAAANEELQIDLDRLQAQIDAAKDEKDKQISIAVTRTALIKATFGEESREYERALAEELHIREEWVRKEQEIMKLRTKMQEAQAQHEVTMEKLALDQAVALRQVSSQQRFAVEKQLEDKVYTMKLAALEAQKASLIAGTKAYVEVDAQIEALEMAHQERLTQIANDAELDRQQFMLQAEEAVQNTFATMLDDLMNRTKSWRDVMLDAVKSITSALNKLAAEQIAKQLFGAGTGGGNLLGSLLGSLFGGGAAPVPSFDVGTPYVPRDTLALVHQGERIIPAAQNRGGGHGSPFQVVNHFNISGPVDSRTQDQIAAAAARATQRAMYRNL